MSITSFGRDVNSYGLMQVRLVPVAVAVCAAPPL